MKLGIIEKRTFWLLMLASFFNGFVMGTFNIQDVVAKKALLALDWQITILVMLWPLSNLFSIWWGKALERSKSISKFFVLTAFVGRLVLLFMLFTHSYYSYLIIMIFVFSFNSLLSPAQNSIYRNNISAENRGVLFGYTASLVTLIAIIFSYSAGKLMDINEDWFRYIFSVAGLMGCVSSLLMAMIKIENKKYNTAKLKLKQFFITPIMSTVNILKKNRDFAIFQRNYFIYGIGFMIILPAIPKFLVEYLKMDYSQTFMAKGIISQLGILLLAPIAGKIHDKKNPSFFTFLAFFTLGCYPLILLISSFLIGSGIENYAVYFAYLIFGIGMSGIIISWNMSSIFFAGDDDVSMYQSVHVTLTGLRALIVPFMGYLILRYFGVRVVFIVSISMFWIASLLSYFNYLRMCKLEFKYQKHFDSIVKYFRRIPPRG
ncbi:MAG: MFS transporter [Candidatus Cloacimonadota bacterium]|nr:MFS transporter [Candidatus Cloacimonadota bacterium]